MKAFTISSISGKKTQWIYWADNISLEDIRRISAEADEVYFLYPHRIAKEILTVYEDTYYVIEGKEMQLGDQTCSLYIDLGQSEEDIFRGFSKNRRYETRRSLVRDEVRFNIVFPSEKDVEVIRYIEFYNKFAREKGRPFLSERMVMALVNARAFAIATAYDSYNNEIVKNAYIIAKKIDIAMLFSSSSLFRSNKDSAQMIGRANGALQYHSMCVFKKLGIKKYDFGGYYEGCTDVDRMNISRYKATFGGVKSNFVTGFYIDFDQIRTIEMNLHGLGNYLINKKIVLYGYSYWGRYIKRRIWEMYSVMPDLIVDNSLCKINENFVSEKVLNQLIPKDTYILAALGENSARKIKEHEYVAPYIKIGHVSWLRIKNIEKV